MATVNQTQLDRHLYHRLLYSPQYNSPGGNARTIAREVARVYAPVLRSLEQRIKVLELIVASEHSGS